MIKLSGNNIFCQSKQEKNSIYKIYAMSKTSRNVAAIASAVLNCSNTQQKFHQFAQFLYVKLEQKLADFRRSRDEKDKQYPQQN